MVICGGMVITGVAEQLRNPISAIVYLDAFLPTDGQSLSTLATPLRCRQPFGSGTLLPF